MLNLDIKGRDYVRDRMPMIGLGTFQVRGKETIEQAINAALNAGYRLIDTAQVYQNEADIGNLLKTLLPKYNLRREDIFITSKLAPANQGPNCEKSIIASLEKLQTDYLDLLLIHWPGTSRFEAGDVRNKDSRRESWKILEKMHKEGKLRSIGVSNYNISHLEELFNDSTILPAVNQCEYHPHFYQPDLVKFCSEKGIHFQAYSSLGSQSRKGDLFADKKVLEMSDKYKCTVTEYLLSWSLCQGMSVLPRSSNPDHIRANFRAKDLMISAEDIEATKHPKPSKICWNPENVA